MGVAGGAVIPLGEQSDVLGLLRERQTGRREGREEGAEAGVETQRLACRGDGKIAEREPGAGEHDGDVEDAGRGRRQDGGAGEAIERSGELAAEGGGAADAEPALVPAAGLFEVEFLAGAVAGGGGGLEEAAAAGFEEADEAGGFGGVFLAGDGLLAGAEAPAHLAVDAAGVVRRGGEILEAAADLEQIEHFLFKTGGSGFVLEGAEAERGAAAEAGGDRGAGPGIGEQDLDEDGRAEAERAGGALRGVQVEQLVVAEQGGEIRGRELVFDGGGELAEAEGASGDAGRAEEAAEAAAQEAGAADVGLAFAEMDDEDGGRIGDGGEVEGRLDAGGEHHSPDSNSESQRSSGAGGTELSARFSSTCASELMPASAVVTPGAERANWRARWASVQHSGKASRTRAGSEEARRAWSSGALAMTVMPKRAASSSRVAWLGGSP